MQLNQSIQQHDLILRAVANLAEIFIKERDWQAAIRRALGTLGIAADVSRVYIFENGTQPGGIVFNNLRYEWNAPGVKSQIDNPLEYNCPYTATPGWRECLQFGKPVHDSVGNMDPVTQALLRPQGILSVLVFPIMVEEKWWGFIGFDECRHERVWSSAEIDALHIAANLFSAALERQQNELVLRRQEADLRGLFGAMQDLVIVYDREGYYLQIAPTKTNNLILPGNDLLGRKISDVLPSKQARLLLTAIRRSLDTRQAVSVEYDLMINGRMTWFSGWISALDENRVVVVVHDVTDQYAAKKELRERQARYVGLFEDSPISLWLEDFSEIKKNIDALRLRGVTDFDLYFEQHPKEMQAIIKSGKILDVNRVTLGLFGYKTKRSLLANIDQIIGEEMTLSDRKSLVFISQGERYCEKEAVYFKANGEAMDTYLWWSVAPGYEKTYSRVVVSIIDITGRKRLEAIERQQRAFAEALSTTIADINSTLNPDEVLEKILENVGNVFVCDAAVVKLIESGVARVIGQRGCEKYIPLEKVFAARYPVVELGDGSGSAEKYQTRIIVDILAERDWVCMPDLEWFRSLVSAPIIVDGELTGFLDLMGVNPNAFTNETAHHLQAFANQAALAFRNARLFLAAQFELDQRRLAERALKDSQERYLSLFENSPVALWEQDFSAVKKAVDWIKQAGVIDLRTYFYQHPAIVMEMESQIRVLDVNKAMLDLYLVENKQALLKHFVTLLDGNDLKPLIEGMMVLAEGGRAFETESINYKSNGEAMDIILQWTVLPGHETTYDRVIISITDVSERKKAERELRENQARYRTLFEDSPIALEEEDASGVVRILDDLRKQGVKDLRTHLKQNPQIVHRCLQAVRILDANRAALRLFGFETKEALINRMPEIIGDEYQEIIIGGITAIGEGHTFFEAEGINIRPDGERVIFQERWVVAPGHEETYDRMIFSAIDISEIRRAEENEHQEHLFAEALGATAADINSTLNLDEVFRRILENMTRVMPWDTAHILMFESGIGRVVQQKGFEKFGSIEWIDVARFVIEDIPDLKAIIRDKTAIVIRNMSSDPDWIRNPSNVWVHSLVEAPVILEGEAVGLLALQSIHPNFFTSDHASRLQAFADQAAIAIHNARLYEASEHELQERILVEEELRGREAKINSIFLAAPVGIGMVVDRVLYEANDRLCQMTGYSRQELVGQRAGLIYPTPGDFEKIERQKFNPGADQRTGTVETRLMCKDGAIIDVSYSSAPLDSADIGKGITFTVLDITERKHTEEALRKSEELYRTLVETSPDAISVTDLQWKMITANLENAKLLGYGSVEDLLSSGKTIIDLLALHDVDRVIQNTQQILSQGVLRDLECTMTRADGTQVLIEMSLSIIHDESQNPVAYIVVSREITQRKQMEAEMLSSQKLASLGTLAAGVAHEMNTPLQLITGISERQIENLNGGRLNEEKLMRNLQTVNQSAWRMAEVVRSLLAYSRGATERVAPHALNTIIHDTLLLTEHQFLTWSNIRVVTDLEPEMPPIYCEQNKISQVVINLLNNARDAMPKGGTISIRTFYNRDKNSASLIIEDTGKGIREEIRSRVFDPFFTTKQVGDGTGLGLSIVMGIVKAHGGNISVESSPEKGTAFVISLPYDHRFPDSDLSPQSPDSNVGRYEEF